MSTWLVAGVCVEILASLLLSCSHYKGADCFTFTLP